MRLWLVESLAHNWTPSPAPFTSLEVRLILPGSESQLYSHGWFFLHCRKQWKLIMIHFFKINSNVAQEPKNFLKALLLHFITLENSTAATAKSLQSCPTLQPHRWQPTRLRSPWDSPGKNTGVGCHFLLQCMKMKSESEVIQSCPTLRDPMDCSLPGFSVHGIFQARVLEWDAIVSNSLWPHGLQHMA